MPNELFSPLLVRIKRDFCNPFAVEWINILGGKSYWVFEYNQTMSNIVNSIGTFVPYISDIENTEIKESNIGTELSQNSIIVEANNLTLNQLNALQDIKRSRQVWRIYPKSSGKKKIGIINSTVTNSYETKNSLYFIQFKFTLPSDYTQDPL